MLVTVFCAPRDRSEITFSLDVSPELELRDFIALCELESGIPAAEIQISYAEQPLQDPTRALGAYGLKDGDVVVLRQAERRPPAQPAFPGLPRIDFSSIAVPGTSSAQPPPSQPQQPEPNLQPQSPPQALDSSLMGPASSPQGLDNPSLLRDMLLANPHELSLLKERNPPLADALLSGDLERFTKVLLEQQQDRARREQERIRLLTSDPFDLEAQAKIEEDIRRHNIEENMTIAMEEAPESFGQVVMLYINCKVNGHPVKAFVDSGAQMTIMSQACAERCNIMRLVDRRWAGIAKGVGTQKIIGRVHLAQVQIEGDFLPCSFSILEDQPMDMLLGLDMLKRHQCSIDLKKSVLLIGTTGSETRFLPEAELPECARLAYGAETRPEEIADRELAEVLQRSAQESDVEDGRTTSQQSWPWSSPNQNDEIPVSASPLDHSRFPALDRSKSAPALLRPPLSEAAPMSVPSPSQSQFQGLTEPAPTTLVPAQANVSQLGSPSHPLGCNPPDPPMCASPEGEPSSHSNSGNVQCGAPTAMEVSATSVATEEEAESVPLSLIGCPDVSPAPPPELVQDCLPDSTKAQPLVSLESPPEQEDSEAVSPQHPLLLSLDAKPTPDTPAATPELCSTPGTPLAEIADLHAATGEAPQPERDQPEGERQPGSDGMPSLAAALMELHELLVSNRCTLSREHSPIPSPTCREDADGVDEGHFPGSLESAWEPTNLVTGATAMTTMETGAAKSECVPDPNLSSLTPMSVDSSGQVENLGKELPEEQEVRCQDAMGESEEAFSMVEEIRGPEPGPCVGPLPPLDLESMDVRQAPEGLQGRGIADGRAAGPEATDLSHFRMEVSAVDELSPPMSSPCHTFPSGDVSDPSTAAAGSSPPTTLEDAPPQPPFPLPSMPSLSPPPLLPPTPSVVPSPPPPAMERFPIAHIQRIQEAGFSAREAAEALELAQGIVELALLLLLARKITVPT
ncbi:protein DDI1 homolog 2 isoform X1 [Paramormyrops kingsleyae]|uniref:DNA-damage inducible protein 2 n=1 Tax=Paramormyrops kingsleyae TaxID=1676925 RepID=A0A3B3RDP8_9TELE|nr:protein DDI1 homolog 2 isoform X1 [Paramormyrops kingsleyae]